LVLLATAVVVVYLIFTAVSSAIQSYQLEADEGRLRDEVQGMAARYQRLSDQRDYLNSDEYIEWIARRELGLVGPGEMGIIVQSEPALVPSEGQAEGEEGSQAEQGQQQGRWWEDIIGR